MLYLVNNLNFLVRNLDHVFQAMVCTPEAFWTQKQLIWALLSDMWEWWTNQCSGRRLVLEAENIYPQFSSLGRSVKFMFSSVQLLSHVQLCNSVNHSTPGLPVHHQLLEFTQTHVHPVSDAIQPSHPLSSPSPPVFSLSQHQGPFKWVSSSHQMAKVLEFQLQHQSFQWTPRIDLL